MFHFHHNNLFYFSNRIEVLMQYGIWAEHNTMEDDAGRDLRRGAAQLILASKAPATINKYLSHFQKWRAWASQRNCTVMPALSYQVGMFLSQCAQDGGTKATIQTCFYAIRWAHLSCALPDPTESTFPRLILEGVRRTSSKPTSKRKPISPDTIHAICASITGPSIRDLRFVAMAVTAYSAFLRVNELLNIKRSHIKFHDDYMTLFIPRSKTDQHNHGKTIPISKTSTCACPNLNLTKYLEATNQRQRTIASYSEA